MKTKNTALLMKKNMVLVPTAKVSEDFDVVKPAYIATAAVNLQALGFAFSKELVESFATLSTTEFISLYKEIETTLRQKVGADVEYNPMYRGFPEEVINAEEGELYLNAILHYLFGVMPLNTEDVERFPLVVPIDYKPTILNVGTEADFDALVTNLISANTSISAGDKEVIEFATELFSTEEFIAVLPETIPLKENLSYVMALCLAKKDFPLEVLSRYFKTATDVLRFAVALSSGDESLSTKPTFRKFKNAERRLLLTLLDNVKAPTEDMLRHKRAWINLGNILHPGSYKNRYPNAYRSFDILRNDLPFEKYMGRVNAALERDDLRLALTLLEKRPGDFARMLDQLLRDFLESPQIIESFGKVADNVSTPVLLQMQAHFKTRISMKGFRTFMPKGKTTMAYNLEDDGRTPLTQLTVDAILNVIETTLHGRFATLDSLGNIYMEDALKNIVVPFSQRSASEGFRTLTRGSRLPASSTSETVRMFIHWKNLDKDTTTCEGYGSVYGDGHRVDIDLSAVAFDTSFNYLGHVSYTNLRNNFAHHSGDITDAPEGAAEFIDIDIKKARENTNVRYIAMNVYSFTGQPFHKIPQLYAGWQDRDGVTGKHFEPLAVKQKFNVTSDAQTIVPMVLDLETNEIIWVDCVLQNAHSSARYCSNVENTLSPMAVTLRAFALLDKANMQELFMYHAGVRGELVDTVAEADTVFSIEPLSEEELITLVPQEPIEVDGELVEQPPLKVKKRNVTITDLDVIMSEFLQ